MSACYRRQPNRGWRRKAANVSETTQVLLTYAMKLDEVAETFLDLYLAVSDDTRNRCPIEARALEERLIGLFERKTQLPVGLIREDRDQVPRLFWVFSLNRLRLIEEANRFLAEELGIA